MHLLFKLRTEIQHEIVSRDFTYSSLQEIVQVAERFEKIHPPTTSEWKHSTTSAMSMVAQCYQACFCSLNTIFILKLNSNSVLNHNFTFKLVLIFNSVVKFNFNFNHKINSKVKMYF